MPRTETFVAKVVNGGRITVDKDVRVKLGIEDGCYVQVAIQKLDLFKSSMHRFYSPRRVGSTVARQVSVTDFGAMKSDI